MKKSILLATAVFTSLILTSCSNNKSSEEKKESTTTTTEAKIYVCPMHPEVTSDKPGTCPKCGMDLEEKTKEEMDMSGKDSTMKMK